MTHAEFTRSLPFHNGCGKVLVKKSEVVAIEEVSGGSRVRITLKNGRRILLYDSYPHVRYTIIGTHYDDE